MLTEGQQNYLLKLDPERANTPVFVNTFDPRTKVIAKEIMGKIKNEIPDADIRFMGASALGISGQNDVDIYIICPHDIKENYLFKLKPVFGEQIKNKWQWEEEEIEVSVYLSDPTDQKFQEQLDIFDLLKNDHKILQEYEKLKEQMNGKSYKEYQVAKYEFYNRVLNITDQTQK